MLSSSNSVSFSGRPMLASKKWHTNPVQHKIPGVNTPGAQFIRTHHKDQAKIQELIRQAQQQANISPDPLQSNFSAQLPRQARRRKHITSEEVNELLQLINKEPIPEMPKAPRPGKTKIVKAPQKPKILLTLPPATEHAPVFTNSPTSENNNPFDGAAHTDAMKLVTSN